MFSSFTLVFYCVLFFFFKQKTAYEMRISDWSSDVCSSDLSTAPPLLSISVWRDKKRYDYRDVRPTSLTLDMPVANEANQVFPSLEAQFKEIGRASCRERVCQYV